MTKLIDELWRGWQAIPAFTAFEPCFATFCLALATAVRWASAHIRPDVFFYALLSGRVLRRRLLRWLPDRVLTAIAGGILGLAVNFGDTVADPARIALLAMFLAVSGLTIWGVEHYRTLVTEAAKGSQAPDPGRGIPQTRDRRAAAPAEEQVLHHSCRAAPGIAGSAADLGPHDHRICSLSATDDLIGRVDGNGCDIMDLLVPELGLTAMCGSI